MPSHAKLQKFAVLLPQDKERILTFAKAELARAITDPVERDMQSWSARWRPEALDHYLPLGWSYGAFDGGGSMIGYILGQPLLFYRGLTQTLWIEGLGYDGEETAGALLETAYRWARDKHFQTLLLEPDPRLAAVLEKQARIVPVPGGLIEWRSSRFQ
ncbi:MAG: hypothetical protein HC902_08550 [Calothrix sp. SM1_5_4]|nr:hypothetical protein [Calothrix sp. SM1_5_4]